MGLFSKHPQATTASPSGGISLSKGERVSLAKPSAGGSDIITILNTWMASGKDYDLKALVLMKDGSQIYVGDANRDEVRDAAAGAVHHNGDSTQPNTPESMTIRWSPDVARVAISSYSALENGRGSFKHYGASVKVMNGSQVISVPARDASADPDSYSLCFCEVIMGPEGAMELIALEQYSARGSERRVGYCNGILTMDIGPEGQYKG